MNLSKILEALRSAQKFDDHIHYLNDFESHKCEKYGCTERASLWTIQRGQVASAIKVLEKELK